MSNVEMYQPVVAYGKKNLFNALNVDIVLQIVHSHAPSSLVASR